MRLNEIKRTIPCSDVERVVRQNLRIDTYEANGSACLELLRSHNNTSRIHWKTPFTCPRNLLLLLLRAGDPRPVRGDVLPGGVHPAGVDALGHRPQPPPRLRQQLSKLPHLHARRGEAQVRQWQSIPP